MPEACYRHIGAVLELIKGCRVLVTYDESQLRIRPKKDYMAIKAAIPFILLMETTLFFFPFSIMGISFDHEEETSTSSHHPVNSVSPTQHLLV